MPDEPPAQPSGASLTSEVGLDKEMAELGYEPAKIIDESGAVFLAYYTKAWSQPVALDEFPTGGSTTRSRDFRPWSPPRSRQRIV